MSAGNTTIGVAVTVLSIDQHVRLPDHHDRRVTGTVRALAIEDNALMVTVALDEPIVIPVRCDDDREVRLYTQHVPAHEVTPFDERDEVVDELVSALDRLLLSADVRDAADAGALKQARAAIDKATGRAS